MHNHPCTKLIGIHTFLVFNKRGAGVFNPLVAVSANAYSAMLHFQYDCQFNLIKLCNNQK